MLLNKPLELDTSVAVISRTGLDQLVKFEINMYARGM